MYYRISFSYKILCLQLTADIAKICKSAQRTTTFIVNALSDVFLWFWVTLFSFWEKKVASFTKTGFHWKQGCVTMCRYAKTF